jgi:predicted nucleic-acid-binding Zn-ribbon protein
MQAERDAALKWLSEKWTEPRRCPICATEEWEIGDVSQLPLYGVTNRMYPVIPVICKNCAYTILFQAIAVGAIPDEDPPQ